MGNQLSAVLNMLACSDLYKYVLNDMECETPCFKCETHKVEIDDEEENGQEERQEPMTNQVSSHSNLSSSSQHNHNHGGQTRCCPKVR